MSTEDIREINRIKRTLRKYKLHAKRASIELIFPRQELEKRGYKTFGNEEVEGIRNGSLFYSESKVDLDRLKSFPPPRVRELFIYVTRRNPIHIFPQEKVYGFHVYGEMSPQTKERVRKAMKELGYKEAKIEADDVGWTFLEI